MSEAFLVVIGLVVGAVLTEVQQRFRRKERLEEQQAAETTALRSWHRDEKRGVYGELAVAINAVERAASAYALLSVGQADEESLEEMRHAVLDADERLHESLAAASFLAPVEIQAMIRMFSARRAEGLMRDVIAAAGEGPEPTPGTLQEQTQALRDEVDELLGALRGDLLGYSAEQVADEVARLKTVRAASTDRVGRVAREAQASYEARARIAGSEQGGA